MLTVHQSARGQSDRQTVYKPVDPEVWGRFFWFVFHTVAARMPVALTDEERQDYRMFLQSFPRVLPCSSCKTHAKEYQKLNPVREQDVESSYSMTVYVHNFHNSVNLRLGKPVLSLKECCSMYEVEVPPSVPQTVLEHKPKIVIKQEEKKIVQPQTPVPRKVVRPGLAVTRGPNANANAIPNANVSNATAKPAVVQAPTPSAKRTATPRTTTRTNNEAHNQIANQLRRFQMGGSAPNQTTQTNYFVSPLGSLQEGRPAVFNHLLNSQTAGHVAVLDKNSRLRTRPLATRA